MWKFYPKVLFVYLNDNQCTRPFRWWLWWFPFPFFLVKKNNLLLLTVHSCWCSLLWMNGWRKRKVIVLATKRSYDRDYTEYLSLGVLSRTNWYISLFSVLGFRSSTSWSISWSRSKSSNIRSIHPVPDLHRYMPLRFATIRHLRLLVAEAYHLWCDHFLVPLCDEKRIHWYPWRTNIPIHQPPVYDI